MDRLGIDRRMSPAERPPQYKVDENGYEIIRTEIYDSGDRYQPKVPVHRLVAVAEYGMDPLSDKVVHHENNIPFDNRPENLQLMDRCQHSILHQNDDYSPIDSH